MTASSSPRATDPAASLRPASPQPSATAAHLVMLVALVVHERLCAALSTGFALDIDAVNLQYGMASFDVAHHAPHPPGYLLYVLVLRGVHALVGGEPFATVQLVARLFSVAAIVFVYLVVRRLRPEQPMLAAFAAVLGAFHPFLVYHAADAQTHTSEAFSGALLLLAVVAYHDKRSVWRAALIGLLLALGSAFRPSFVVVGIGPILWVIGWRRWTHIVVAGFTAVAGALAYLFPTFAVSGGYALWSEANNTLVSQTFAGTYSALSATSESDMVLYNVKAVLIWAGLLAAPLLVANAAGYRGFRLDATGREARRLVGVMLLWAGLPGVIFYGAFYASEPGYLAGLVALVLVSCVVSVPTQFSKAWRGLALGGALAAQIAVLALPDGASLKTKIPSIPQLMTFETLAGGFMAQGLGPIPRELDVLVVTDGAGFPIHRQLPLLRPGADVLWVHSPRYVMFDQTSISYARREGWTPIPGPVMLSHGPPTILDSGARYDVVLVDLFMTSPGRAELRAQTPCSIADEGFVVLDARVCFAAGRIAFDGYGITFTPGSATP